MKIFIIGFLAMVIRSHGYAQNPNDASIGFKISSGPASINRNVAPVFILAIVNKSEEPVNFSSDIIMAPKTSAQRATSILYEVNYCNPKDTTDITRLIRTNINTFNRTAAKDIWLKRDEKYSFSSDSSIRKGYFYDPGIYRIRFYLRKEMIPDKMTTDIVTPWCYFTVK